MLTIIDKFLAALANYSAKTAVNTASFWNSHQPKEPQNISKQK